MLSAPSMSLVPVWITKVSEASAGVGLGHARLDWGCCALLLWFVFRLASLFQLW